VASHLQKERVKVKKSKLSFNEYITQQIVEVEQRQARRKRASLDSFMYLQSLRNNNSSSQNNNGTRNSYGPVTSTNSFSESQPSVVCGPSSAVSYQSSSDDDKIRDIFESDFPSIDRVSFRPKENDLEMLCLPQVQPQPQPQPIAHSHQQAHYYAPAPPASPSAYPTYEDYDFHFNNNNNDDNSSNTYSEEYNYYYPPAPSTISQTPQFHQQPQPHYYEHSMPQSPEPHHFAPHHHAYSSPYAYVDNATYALN